MTRNLAKFARSLVAAGTTTVCMAFGPTAQAAFYQESFDPIGLVVNVIFEADSSCFSGPNGWVFANAFQGSPACNVSMRSIVAKLTDGANGNPYVYIPFLTLTDSPVSNAITAIYDAGVDGMGHPIPGGISWFPNWFGPKTIPGDAGDGSTGVGDPALAGTYALSFFPYTNFLNDPPHPSTATLYENVQHCIRFFGCHYAWDAVDTAVVDLTLPGFTNGFQYLGDETPVPGDDGLVHVSALVPEPGSMALLAGALGAVWLTRRRRSAA